jgi:4-hydroxy 2-oxovalerate aldolase
LNTVKLLDCTLRDGGYYNEWDFEPHVIEEYLHAMNQVSVNYVELGLRSLEKSGFKGPCAFTTDNFIKTLAVPFGMELGVMVNASELIKHEEGVMGALEKLFVPAENSPISLVRIACHVHEFEPSIKAVNWLKEQGYIVGYNLMQIADRKIEEIEQIAEVASKYPIDVLYFADSLGSLSPEEIPVIIAAIRKYWHGELGIHTHDNMGYALANSLQAIQYGVTWIDGTVTGMGRGPGNAKTEYLAVELENIRNVPINISPLLSMIEEYFKPLQDECGWGTNTFYYLAGKYGIHPTYIQEMINDSTYDSEDILAVIESLRNEESHKYSSKMLANARNFYHGECKGTWNPASEIMGRTVLILGTGKGIEKHKVAIQEYIKIAKPYVIALNTQQVISGDLIDLRAVCHPSRLLADLKTHTQLPQPLAIPLSMLKKDVQDVLKEKDVRDFGIHSLSGQFNFEDTFCEVPKILVIAYALAIATSGKAKNILLAGFDGYNGEDKRNDEMNALLTQYMQHSKAIQLTAITPTKYQLPKDSIYQMMGELIYENNVLFTMS